MFSPEAVAKAAEEKEKAAQKKRNTNAALQKLKGPLKLGVKKNNRTANVLREMGLPAEEPVVISPPKVVEGVQKQIQTATLPNGSRAKTPEELRANLVGIDKLPPKDQITYLTTLVTQQNRTVQDFVPMIQGLLESNAGLRENVTRLIEAQQRGTNKTLREISHARENVAVVGAKANVLQEGQKEMKELQVEIAGQVGEVKALQEEAIQRLGLLQTTSDKILTNVKDLKNTVQMDIRNKGYLRTALDHQFLMFLMFFIVNPYIPFTGQLLQGLYTSAYTIDQIINLTQNVHINGKLYTISMIGCTVLMLRFYFELYSFAPKTMPELYQQEYYNYVNIEQYIGSFLHGIVDFIQHPHLPDISTVHGFWETIQTGEVKARIMEFITKNWDLISQAIGGIDSPADFFYLIVDIGMKGVTIAFEGTTRLLALPPWKFAFGRLGDSALWIASGIMQTLWKLVENFVWWVGGWMKDFWNSIAPRLLQIGGNGNGQMVLYQNPQAPQLTLLQGLTGNLVYHYTMLRLHTLVYPVLRPTLQPIVTQMIPTLESLLTVLNQPTLGFTNFPMIPQPTLLEDTSSITEGLEIVAKGIGREWKNIPNNNRNKYAIVPYVAPKGGKRKTRKGKSRRAHTRKRRV